MRYGGMLGIHPQSVYGGSIGGGISLSSDELLQSERLMHYKTYGEESYVFRNRDMMYEMYRCYPMSMNEPCIAADALEFVLSENSDIGLAIGNIYGIPKTIDWKSISTLTDFANNQDAASIVWENQFLMEAIKRVDVSVLVGGLTEETVQKIVVSQELMDILCSSVPMLRRVYDLSVDNVTIRNAFHSSKFLINSIKKNDSIINTPQNAFIIEGPVTGGTSTRELYDSPCFIIDLMGKGTNNYNPYFLVGSLSGQIRVNVPYGTGSTSNPFTLPINKLASKVEPTFKSDAYISSGSRVSTSYTYTSIIPLPS